MRVEVVTIDKLYVARYGYDKKGNLDFSEDSEVGIRNTLLKQYLRVLRTEDNTGSLKLSIDNATDNVKSILRDIEGSETFRPAPFEVYTPTYQEARKAEYTGGKAGIGPFALNNAHHILTLLVKLKIASNPFTDAMQLTDLGRIFDQPTATDMRGGRILDWLSAMINAFVDIAKDPYIVRLNVNAWTYNMVSFLLRTGKGKQTFYFMCQPILKEMAQEVLKTKGKYGIDKTKTPSQLENEAINKVLDKYDPEGKYRKMYQLINNDDLLSATKYARLFETRMVDGVETSDLRELLLNPEFVGNHDEAQVMIYYCWLKMKPYSDALANLVKYSKVDTKKYGNTFAAQLNYYEGMLALCDNPCFAEGEVQRFYDETFVGHKSDNAILLGTQIFRNRLLRCTDLFIKMKDETIALLGRKGIADDKLVNSVISAMESLIKAQFFNQFARENNINIRGMFTGNFSMAKRLNNFKTLINRRDPRVSHLIDNDGNITNDFLEFLIPNINDIDGSGERLDFISTSELLDVELSKANNLINYWRELIEDPDAQISKLFKDLVVYAFITSGDNPVMNSFFQYVPNSYRTQMGYTQFIRKLLSDYVNGHSDLHNAQIDLFKNNWSNDKLVKPIRISDANGNPMLGIYAGNEFPSVLMGARVSYHGELESAIKPINWITDEKTGNKYPIFPPYVKTRIGTGNRPKDWHLYELVGYRTYSENSNRNAYIPVYGLVSKKGYKYRGNTVTEYGVNTLFGFNKEDELDYITLMNDTNELVRMADSEFADYGVYWATVNPISSLESYKDSSFLNRTADTGITDTNDDSDLTDFEGSPLQDKDEPDPLINHQAPAQSNAINSNSIASNTESFGVVIDSNLKSNYVRWQLGNPNGIVAYRVNFNNYNTALEANAGRIGNPFSETTRGEDTVLKFMNWLLTGNNYGEPKATEEYRLAIINKILNTPEGSPVLYYRELGRPSHATVIGYLINNKQLLQNRHTVNNVDDYVLHSGGALGADLTWGSIAEEYGIPNTPDRQKHYYSNDKTPGGNVHISSEDYNEGKYKVAQAAKANYGYQYATMKNDLLIRDWSLVKHSDAVFAVGTIVNTGLRLFPNIPNDTRVASHIAVTGGTGYAVEMAIQAGKPVYVFDQSRNEWYKNINRIWSRSDTPTLTPNFAGIGTRLLKQNGIDAIRSVFEKTFPLGITPSIDIWSSSGEYSDLSNFATRPFTIHGVSFKSVELAFLYAKAVMFKDGDTAQKIMNASTGSEMRALGKQVANFDPTQWDSKSSSIMYTLMRASFELNPQALQRLLSTGTARLTHLNESQRSKWRNEFPKILMRVRNDLRNVKPVVNNIASIDDIIAIPNNFKQVRINVPGTNNVPVQDIANIIKDLKELEKGSSTEYKSMDDIPQHSTYDTFEDWDIEAPIHDYFAKNPDKFSLIEQVYDALLDSYEEYRWDGDFKSLGDNFSEQLENILFKLGAFRWLDPNQLSFDFDINNTDNTNNDPANFASAEESLLTLQSARTILTNEELRQIRPFTGTGRPRIAVASEHSDPVFFALKIMDILDGKLSVEDKFYHNRSYTGKDFAALYIITKHDGLPLKKLLEYKIPKIIHFSITGLGSTVYEPGVMKPDDLLDRIKDFLDQGLDPNMVTIRIDPIVLGVTEISTVEHIIKRASEMGLKNIRFSIMDKYNRSEFMQAMTSEKINYDFDKYYVGNDRHARPEKLKEVVDTMLKFKEKYGVNLSTCAEPISALGVSKESCLSVAAVNNMLGTQIPDTSVGKQRKGCSCFGGKTDLLKYDDTCKSSCVYCYAGHNSNVNVNYYNEDGTLKDNAFTRTRENVSDVARDKKRQLREAVKEGTLPADSILRFETMLKEENPSTIEEVEGLFNKFICDNL